MQLARLQRPRASQNFYGAAPSLPNAAPYAGATMAPPMPAAPRTTGRAATPGVNPYVPPPVVTDPNITPFRQSLNAQRADEATKAENFADAAPLPMHNGVYSGAYGEGPGGQKLAEAARSNFIGHNESIIDQQDLGPGIGVRSFSNKLDADYAAAHPYVSPMDKAKIGAINAWSDNVPGSQANKNNAGADLDKAKAGETTALTKPKADALSGTADERRARGEALKTTADAKAKQMAQKGNPFDKDRYRAENTAANNNATAMLRAAISTRDQRSREYHEANRNATNFTLSEPERAKWAATAESLKTQLETDHTNVLKAQQEGGQMRNDATNPDRYVPPAAGAQGGQPTEPGASAAPAGGQELVGHDPAKRTPAAIAETARNRGISEEEVLKRLGVTA